MMVEAESIQIGDLDRRLAVPTTGDEISDLAATLNKMLDRVPNLIVAVDTGYPGDLRYALGSTLSGPPVHADNPTRTS